MKWCQFLPVSKRKRVLQIVNEIKYLLESKRYSYKDIADIVSCQLPIRIVEEAFSKYKIPYHVENGMSFYERHEVRTLLEYLRFIDSPDSDEGNDALRKIINVPNRYIGKSFITELEGYAGQKEVHLYKALKTMRVKIPPPRKAPANGGKVDTAARFLLGPAQGLAKPLEESAPGRRGKGTAKRGFLVAGSLAPTRSTRLGTGRPTTTGLCIRWRRAHACSSPRCSSRTFFDKGQAPPFRVGRAERRSPSGEGGLFNIQRRVAFQLGPAFARWAELATP